MPYGQSLGRHLPHQSIRYGFNAPNLAFLLFSADAFLHFHESRQTLLLQRLWHMITQRIRCSAIYCRISKTPYPIQLGLLLAGRFIALRMCGLKCCNGTSR